LTLTFDYDKENITSRFWSFNSIFLGN